MDDKLKEDLCEAGRRLYANGFIAAMEGNLSIRTGVLPPSSVATPCLNANVSWPACVGERY